MSTITTTRTRHIRQCALAVAVAVGAPAWAQNALPSTSLSGARSSEGPRAFLYWRLPLDGGAPRAAQYGLRLDSAPLRFGAQVRSLPIVDLGLGGGRTTVKTLGAVAFDSSDLGSPDSFKNPYFWLAAGVGALAISCVTEHFPCKKDDNGSGTYSAPGNAR
jgi:hypothetical protein